MLISPESFVKTGHAQRTALKSLYRGINGVAHLLGWPVIVKAYLSFDSRLFPRSYENTYESDLVTVSRPKPAGRTFESDAFHGDGKNRRSNPLEPTNDGNEEVHKGVKRIRLAG